MIVPVLIFLILFFVAVRFVWLAARNPASSAAVRSTAGGVLLVIGTLIVLGVLWVAFVFVVFAFGGVKPPMY